MAPGTFDRMWGWALRTLLLPAGGRLFRHRMVERLRFLEEAQWWTPQRIHQERDRLLRHTVAVAYESVPLYRDLMDGAGMAPRDITIADLHRLPVVTKRALRENYPQRVTRRTGYPVSENRTSGSTGTNFVVLVDTQTVGWYRAAFLLMLEWAGWRLGERHVQTGMNLDRSIDRLLKDRMLRCRYVSAYDLTDEHLDRTLGLIETRRIKHLWGYPGSLYYLARRALELGWNEPLRSAVTWGDTLTPHHRQTISKAFACRVHDTYGCAEGIQVAGECGEEEGYHILELDTIVEFVDEEGNPVRRGERGSLLLTRLHPGPMPLIRYRLGDLGREGSDRACPCGRGLGRMASIEGRETDVVMTPGGNRLIVHFFTGLLEHFAEIDEFQVVQESIDRATLRITPTSGFTRETAHRIVRTLHDHGADGLQIDVEPVSEIPLAETGKRRFVISELTDRQPL